MPSAQRTSVGFARFVDPPAVAHLANRLLRAPWADGSGPVHDAALLFDYVAERVEYDDSDGPNYRRPPRFTRREDGNCVDQCVLLASLWGAENYDWRLLGLGHPTRGHMVAQVHIDGPQATLHQQMHDWIERHHEHERLVVAWEPTPSGRWYWADPTSSRCLGDVAPLLHHGYLTRSNDGITVADAIDLRVFTSH